MWQDRGSNTQKSLFSVDFVLSKLSDGPTDTPSFAKQATRVIPSQNVQTENPQKMILHMFGTKVPFEDLFKKPKCLCSWANILGFMGV